MRASPFQSTGNSSRILQTVPSLFGTRQHAPGLISSTPSRHIFNRTLSRRPVYRNWWTRRENHHQKSISHHCQYRVPVDYPESEQLSCSAHLSKYDSIPLSRPHPTFHEPDILNQIDDAAPHSWKHDHLNNAHALLTAATPNSRNLIHHILASRAIVRARLRQWEAALVDAEKVPVALFLHILTLTSIYTKAIKIQPSVIGYIAKSVALVGIGEKHEGYRACDIGFERFHSFHISFSFWLRSVFFELGYPSAVHFL